MAARAALAAPAGYFASARFFNPDLDVVRPRMLNGESAGPASARLSFVVGHGSRKRLVSRRVAEAHVRPRISGRLTSVVGAPISGARVWAASAVANGVWHITGAPLTTSPSGRVSGRLPAHGPSRAVRLVYFPYSDSSDNVQSPSRRLAVRAVSQRRHRQLLRPYHDPACDPSQVRLPPGGRAGPLAHVRHDARGLGGPVEAALPVHRDPAPHGLPLPGRDSHRRRIPVGGGTLPRCAGLGYAMRAAGGDARFHGARLWCQRALDASNIGGCRYG
jgi:hypothetical protein